MKGPRCRGTAGANAVGGLANAVGRLSTDVARLVGVGHLAGGVASSLSPVGRRPAARVVERDPVRRARVANPTRAMGRGPRVPVPRRRLGRGSRPLLVGLNAVNAAARTVSGSTRAVAGVVNDGARVVGAVNVPARS